MNKSKMSAQEVESREKLVHVLESSGWVLRNVDAYNADLSLDAELTARKRNSQCIMEVNVSYENSYVGIAIANFKSGRAEYITYFKNLYETSEILHKILAKSETMTVLKSSELAQELILDFKDKVYFFNGEVLEPLISIDD